MSDASFADGAEKPVRIWAQDQDDLQVISSLVQDAIAERKEMIFERDQHSFSLLIKRFRWEDVPAAQAQNREFERVQSVLGFRSVQNVQYSGFLANDRDLAFDLIGILPKDGALHLIFAGDGEIKLSVEAIDVYLTDVSRPYVAKAQSIPQHGEGFDVSS